MQQPRRTCTYRQHLASFGRKRQAASPTILGPCCNHDKQAGFQAPLPSTQ
eukprot:CAMPEP_0171058784 /NCGR_PEP_ID=MMETSP0766_2-20121228/2731_1 /TAXON_ID=439317 /ORGANISM="Gambierdiscus australes, Strain CAWD 149" /LENGTH=49 /DNA_ID=CAMNT_0011514111 /DNA_START=207 /DNA_END=356 /DNA_ORIENTATION=+